jgi:ABC-type uncharacterized transport system ATPase subunit
MLSVEEPDGARFPRRRHGQECFLHVRAGEIVGIAGVAGNGQSELLQAITGIRRAVKGKVLLQGSRSMSPATADPAELRHRGLAHVPEDRQHMGLVLKFDESENSILGYHDDPKYLNGMFLNIDAIRRMPPTRSRNTISARPIRG